MRSELTETFQQKLNKNQSQCHRNASKQMSECQRMLTVPEQKQIQQTNHTHINRTRPKYAYTV